MTMATRRRGRPVKGQAPILTPKRTEPRAMRDPDGNLVRIKAAGVRALLNLGWELAD